jgi:hypothetical protein
MLFINETPIHFGVILLLTIILLLFVLLGIIGVLRSEQPSASDFAGFTGVLFGFLAFMILTASVFVLPAAATAGELLIYYLSVYSFVGLHGFSLVFYFIGVDWFKKRMWAAYLPILGTLSWFVFMWFTVTPATVTIVSDGALNYISMPFSFLLYSAILTVIYLFLVPLWSVFRLTKRREGSMKTWTWIAWFGFLLWFIAVLLMAMVQYTVAFMIYIFILASFAWILIFLGWYMTTQRS